MTPERWAQIEDLFHDRGVIGFRDQRLTDELDLTALGIHLGDITITSANGNAQVAFGGNLIVVVGQAGHVDPNDLLL